MVEPRVTFAQLLALLRERAMQHHARNLVLAALSLETAQRDARQLAEALAAEYLDFDCELLARIEADGWDDHVALERRGTLSIGQALARDWLGQVAGRMALARDWLGQVAGRINRARPLVVGSLNLAVRYQIDVAAALYDATERGLCVIAAAGARPDLADPRPAPPNRGRVVRLRGRAVAPSG